MTKREAGWVLGIGGAAVIGIGLFTYSKATGDVGCALTAAGLGIIVEGVSKGHAGEAVLVSAGVGLACKPLVEGIINGSSEDVSFDLETPSGEQHFELPPSLLDDPLPTTVLGCLARYPSPSLALDLCRVRVGLATP